MAYLVEFAARAERDLALLYERINAQSSAAALEWYFELKKSILSLEEHPNRCPVIRKKDKLRHLLLGRKPPIYRVIYRVSEKRKQVVVLHTRHGARRRLGKSALP